MTGKELFEATVGKMTALYPQINQDVLEANIERMFLEHNLEKTDIENPAFDDFQKELDLYFNRLIAFSNPEEEIFESPILKDNTADATPILEEQLKLLIQQAQIRERELAIKYDEEISRSDDENTALKVQISNLVAENLKLKRTAAMVPELEQEILSQQSMIVEQGLMIASLEREGKHTLSDLTSENKLLNLAQTENDELRKAKAKLEKELVTARAINNTQMMAVTPELISPKVAENYERRIKALEKELEKTRIDHKVELAENPTKKSPKEEVTTKLKTYREAGLPIMDFRPQAPSTATATVSVKERLRGVICDTSTADGCVQKFKNQHKTLFDQDKKGFLGSFKHTKLDSTNLSEIIAHAAKSNNRSRKALVDLGWMDKKGKLTNNAPSPVKDCAPRTNTPKPSK